MKADVKTKRFLATSIAAYVGSLGFLTFPGSADAYVIRRTGTECEPADDENDVMKAHGYFRNNSSGSQHVFCPIDGSSDLGMANINTVNIHGSFAGGDARACTKAWNSGDIICGAYAGYSSANHGAVITDMSGLDETGNFGYIHVVLPSGKSINGYFVAD